MKVLAIALLAMCASGCVMTRSDTIMSALTLNVKSPNLGFVDNSVRPAKMGIAKASGILCFCEGDASLKAAMDNGQITKIHHVDHEVKNILGIVGEYTTIVYGE